MNPFAGTNTDSMLALAGEVVTGLVNHDFPWFTLAEGDVPTLARQLAVAKELTDAARGVQSQIEKACARALRDTRGIVEVPGLGTIERHGGKKRTEFDHPAIVSKLAEKAHDLAMETGEHPADVAARIVADAAGMDTASASWRATSLRKYDIDPDKYATVDYGQPTVQLVVNSTAEEAA